MKSMAAHVVLLSAACIGGVATADQAPEGHVIGMGPGVDVSCADFVMAMSRSAPQDWYRVDGKEFASKTAYVLAWVQGYVSGSNSRRPSSQQTGGDLNQIAVWLDGYCRKNPRALVWSGAMSYINSQ